MVGLNWSTGILNVDTNNRPPRHQELELQKNQDSLLKKNSAWLGGETLKYKLILTFNRRMQDCIPLTFTHN
jgi:hypothetical protein